VKPALEKFLLIAATLAAIGLFVFVAMWSSIKEKKTQMDDLFNNTNVPSSFNFESKPPRLPAVSLNA
jgi:flagellar biosynthesis/type III secretory pathway M-ring protein FliF/YscJ